MRRLRGVILEGEEIERGHLEGEEIEGGHSGEVRRLRGSFWGFSIIYGIDLCNALEQCTCIVAPSVDTYEIALNVPMQLHRTFQCSCIEHSNAVALFLFFK